MAGRTNPLVLIAAVAVIETEIGKNGRGEMWTICKDAGGERKWTPR
jgi:hypothetical protein